MRLSAVFYLIIMIGGIFFTFASMVQEANTTFPDADINSSAWDSQYDLSDSVSNYVAPLEYSFRHISDPNVGFFTKIGLGLVAIPYAIISFPLVAFNVLALGMNIIIGFAVTLSIPTKIITLITLLGVVFGIMKLIELWQRVQV